MHQNTLLTGSTKRPRLVDIYMKRKTYSDELNFITLRVVDWIDVFTKRVYSDFVIDCLKYCRKEKVLEVYAYVLMTNHLHMIVKSFKIPLTDVLRYFKTYTSKELYKMIEENRKEGKKSWMLGVRRTFQS